MHKRDKQTHKFLFFFLFTKIRHSTVFLCTTISQRSTATAISQLR